MAVNKRKVLENARKFVQKGAVEKALKEYQKILKADPRDSKIRLEIGDAYRRWGKVEEAVDAYLKVANQYMNEGFDARSVAVFKQILNLDPECYSAYEPLADLYQRMGLIAESIHSLQVAADGYYKQGRKQDALSLLRKMATLDSTNTSSRIKIADLLKQEGMNEEALAEYDGALTELKRHSDREAQESVYERILEIEPKRVATLQAYAKNLLEGARAAEAESIAKRALAADPGEIRNFELLAEVYSATKDAEALTTTYRGLADLHRERGEEDLAREILQRFVPANEFAAPASDLGADFEPESQPDSIHASDSVDLLGGQGPLDIGLDIGEEDEEFLPDDTFDDGIGDSENEKTIVAPRVDEPTRELDASPALSPAEIEQKLAEASVYLRYGKTGPAIEYLQQIIIADPQHVAALENLGEAHAENGDRAGAVEAWLRAARVAHQSGDNDLLGVLRDRIAALDESAARGLDPFIASGAEGESDFDEDEYLDVTDSVTNDGPAAASAIDSEVPPDLDFEDDLGLGFEKNVDDDIDIELGLDVESGSGIESEAGDDPELDIDEVIEFEPTSEVERFSDEIEIDASEFDDEWSEQSPDLEPQGKQTVLSDVVSPADVGASGPEAAVPDASAAASLDTASGNVSTSQRILEDLEEAEFYLEQGITDEAEAILQRLLLIAPNHPIVLVRLGEIAAARGDDPEQVESGPSMDAPSEFLAEEPASESAAPEQFSGGESEAGLPKVDLTEVVEPEIEFDSQDIDESEEYVEFASSDDNWRDVETGEYEIEIPPAEPEFSFADSTEGSPLPSDDELPELGADPTPVAVEDSSKAEDTFDLAAELSQAIDDEVGGAPYDGMGAGSDDFSAVFQEFKKGVDASLSDGDFEAHYDLGIAYREMGLLDDAISEFRTSTKSPAREVDGLHMIGLCSLDMNRPSEAITHFSGALSVPTITDEQKLAVRFELGRAFRSAGDIANARDAFEAVAAIDPLFCEVEQELETLDKLKAESQVESGEGEVDSGYESFDDLISEVSNDQVGSGEMENFEDLFSDDPKGEGDASPLEADARGGQRKKKFFGSRS